MAAHWEPGAPHPLDRIAALEAFHQRGIETWVSLEPALNTEETLAIVEATHRFVDFYKVGRLNYLKCDIDWQNHTDRVVALLEQLGKRYYLKQDLVGFLPETHTSAFRIL